MIFKIPNHAINLNLQLQKSKSIPNYLKLACSKAFIQHLLFVKKIIPYSPDYVLEEYENYKEEEKEEAEEEMKEMLLNQKNKKRKEEEMETEMKLENNRNSKFKIHVDNDENDEDDVLVSIDDDDDDNANHANHANYITTTSSNYNTRIGANMNTDHSNNNQILLKQQRTRTRTRKEMTTHRQIIKCGEQLHLLLQDLKYVFDHHDGSENNNNNNNTIKAILITIGPSLHSPREQYLIQFHSWFESDTTTSNTTSTTIESNNTLSMKAKERNEYEISRRIIREYITGIFEYESNQNLLYQKQLQELQSKQQQQQQQETKQLLIQHGHESENKQRKKRRRNHNQIRNALSNNNITRIDNTVSNNMNSSSKLKLHVTCLVSQHVIQQLFQRQQEEQKGQQQQQGEMASCTVNTKMSSQLSPQYYHHHYHKNQYVIERDFTIKVPRMIHKKRNIHRPFVVMNVQPMINPTKIHSSLIDNSNKEIHENNEPTCRCQQEKDDVWISFKSKIKGFVKK